jgi:xanthine dehydrogenase small subunit
MPLLLALGASLVLMRWQGSPQRGHMAHRELLLEDFYTGYRRNVLRPDELLAWIKVPKPVRRLAAPVPPQATGDWTRVYKISKRREDDISAVCLAVSLQLKRGQVQSARLGLGGVAATPVRAPKTEAALTGQSWNARTVQNTMQVLEQEFQPLSDHRASADYRRQVLAHLLWRCWLDSQPPAMGASERTNTAALDLADLEPLA